jgi:hypothetical protein
VPRPTLRAEANLALQCAAEASHMSLRGYLDKAEASTHTEVDRAHALLVDAYRQLGARTAPFDASGKEVGLRFLGWLQEELKVLPATVTGLMSFTSLITCEGATNALSYEGCRHFKVFDRSDEDFDRRIFQVEDEGLSGLLGCFMIGCGALTTVILSRKDLTGRWSRYGFFFGICTYIWCYFCRCRMMRRSTTLEAWRAWCLWQDARAGIGEQLAPPTGAGEDPVTAAAPPGEDTLVAAAPAAEDPAASAGPLQVAG